MPRPRGAMQRVWATPLLQEAAWRERAEGEPAWVPAPGLRSTLVATWPLPLEAWSPWLPNPRPRRGPRSPHASPRSRSVADALPLHAPRRGGRDEGLRPGAPWRWSGRPPRGSLPPLSLSKSLKALAPFVTPGASNHSVSISLTLFIPLKTHLKTLQRGVCSGLYPH